MFSSSTSFPFINHTTENSSPTDHDHPPPFSTFPPPPFLDHNDFLAFNWLSPPAHQEQQQQQDATTKTKATKKPTSRKRVGKKDRHSKIYTAQGPRDRRMRLSLQIARKFFDLQDMLGFDKASKTIEWLFTKSKTAIKELTENALPQRKHICSGGVVSSGSSTSESEVASQTKVGDRKDVAADHCGYFVQKSKKVRQIGFSPIARESRDKARERARERTREKMKMKCHEKSMECCDEANPNKLDHESNDKSVNSSKNEIGSPLKGITLEEEENPLGEGEGEGEQGVHDLLEHQMDSVSIFDKFLGVTSANSENHYQDFPGNWEISNEKVHHSHCTMTNMKPFTGNIQAQNPSSNLMSTSDTQEQQNPSPHFLMTSSSSQEQNPTSVFVLASNFLEGNPNLVPLTAVNDGGLQSNSLENHYSCNPIKYRYYY